MVFYGTVCKWLFQRARTEVRPWEVRFAHPWRAAPAFPIHIAMGGYASHGRTSVRALKSQVGGHGERPRNKLHDKSWGYM